MKTPTRQSGMPACTIRSQVSAIMPAGLAADLAPSISQSVSFCNSGAFMTAAFVPQVVGPSRRVSSTPRPIFVIASEAKQSMSQRGERWIASSLSLLAMTGIERPHTPLSSSAKAEDPVRRGLSVLSSASLEYWIRSAVRARTMTARCVSAFSRRIAPEVCWKFFALSKSEGAGNAGCALHPRSHAQCAQKVRA